MKAKMNSGPSVNEVSERPPEVMAKDHPFLDGLKVHQHRLLTDCSMEVHFNPGEVIFREGNPADCFYLIQKGKVALEAHTQNEGLELVQILGDGEALGWSWLFPPYFWHFDARALEPTDALRLDASMLRDECDADPELGYALTKRFASVMLQRLQATRRLLLKERGFSLSPLKT